MDIRNAKEFMNCDKMTIFSTLTGDTYFVTKKEGGTYIVTGGNLVGSPGFSVFNDTMISRNGRHYVMATVNFGNLLSSIVIDDMIDELELFKVKLPEA